MEIKKGQIWRNKKSGNLVQVVPDPCVLVFTSPKGELVAEYSLVVFEQLYEPVDTEDAQMIKPKHPSSIKNKDLTLPDNCIENKTQSKAEPFFDAMKRFSEMLPKAEGEDMVNRPPHYKDASGIECKEITCHRKMPFSLGNAIKYLYRAGSKGDLLEDLKKAHWYIKGAYFNNEVIPKDVVRKLEEVAAHRTVDIKLLMLLISRNDLIRASNKLKQMIDELESGNE